MPSLYNYMKMPYKLKEKLWWWLFFRRWKWLSNLRYHRYFEEVFQKENLE